MANQWMLQLDPLYGDEPVTFTGSEDDIVTALMERFPDLIQEIDGESLQEVIDHLDSRIQAFNFHLQPLAQQLNKGWPKDDQENEANQAGFFGSPDWQVAVDQHLEGGGGVKVKTPRQNVPPPPMKSVAITPRDRRRVRENAGQDPAQIAMESGNDNIVRAYRANNVANGALIPMDAPERDFDGGPYALGRWPAPSPEPASAYNGWDPAHAAPLSEDRQYWEEVSNQAGIPPRPVNQRLEAEEQAKKVVAEREKGLMWRLRNVKPTRKSEDDANLQQLVEDMLGFAPTKIPEFRAARLLARNQAGIDPPLEQLRRALYEHPTDMVAAALKGFGLAITASNRAALQQIQELGLSGGKRMVKAESPALDPELLTHIRALDDDGHELEEALRQAVQAQHYEQVHLEGKHSKGTILVQTKDQGNWLLKPGSGAQSPAAGARQDNSTQSQREAAFWHVTRRWGMAEDFPRTELMDVGGQPYAVIEMLPYTWQNVGRIDTKDHRRIVQAVEKYRPSGTLHRWAVIDYVLGNPDRHQQNLMIGPSDELKLIDHGSAFAGTEFDPARDRRSFIPYYLRASVPLKNWDAYTPKQRMTFMPVIPEASQRQVLTKWIVDLDADLLGHQLQHFGIDPRPSQLRLQQLQKLVMSLPMQPDRVINQLWATT